MPDTGAQDNEPEMLEGGESARLRQGWVFAPSGGPTSDPGRATSAPLSYGEDPWGRADAPAVDEGDLVPLSPALADIEAMLEAGEDRPVAPEERHWLPGAADLPEVAALAGDGWEPLPTGFMGFEYALLPAVWPREHRRWVRDRMPKYQVLSYGDGPLVLGPEMGGDRHQRWLLAGQARSLGLPPPPQDRIWLLRSPWPSLRLSSLLLLFRQHRDRRQLGWDATGVLRAAQELLTLSEEEVWSLWTGRQADAARGWNQTDTRDRDVDAWINLGLGPTHVAALLAPVGEGGAGLTPAQARSWCEVTTMTEAPGEEVVARTVAWRRVGLPADAPVEQLGMVLLERDPDEVATWLAAGLTAEDVADWQAVDLQRALTWRAGGFNAREARRLVEADPTITPAEAARFDALGIAPFARARWVACGFSAEEARAWTDIDIVASEARVWRAGGRGVNEARAERAAGGPALPPDMERGWAAAGPDRDDVHYGVSDPPGTRGCVAGNGPEPFDLR